MPSPKDNDGLDVVGFGKIAKAIPPKVYELTATTLVTTFQALTAPITETTSGLGRYLRQKFDNMVDAEKAIATYTVEQAVIRARRRLATTGRELLPPPSSKTFVRSIEEASKETDPLLHEMWVNLITSQITSDKCHPHFVEILSHFSPAEARLLAELVTESEVGENEGGYITIGEFAFDSWVPRADADPRPWSISCTLLFDFAFINLLSPKGPTKNDTTILYRTKLGSAFLSAVSPSPDDLDTPGAA
jgi:hypothetical protein